MKKALTIFLLFFILTLEGSVPKRIISLAPNTTEVLFALNLKSHIIADTIYCNYPDDAKKIKHVGGFSSVDLEALISEKPDLIVTVEGAQRSDVLLAIERMKLFLKVYPAKSIGDIYKMINSIGVITGRMGRAEEVISKIKGDFVLAQKFSKKRRVKGIYLLSLDPPIVVGGNSFINEVMDMSGVENIFRDEKSPYPQIDLESLFSQGVEIILIPSDQKSMEVELFKNIPSLRNNITIKIVNADITLRPSPRIGLGAIDIARKVWAGK